MAAIKLSPAQLAMKKAEELAKKEAEAKAATQKEAGKAKKERYLKILVEEKAVVQRNTGGWMACALAGEKEFKGQPVPECFTQIAKAVGGLIEKLATDRAMARMKEPPVVVTPAAKK